MKDEGGNFGHGTGEQSASSLRPPAIFRSPCPDPSITHNIWGLGEDLPSEGDVVQALEAAPELDLPALAGAAHGGDLLGLAAIFRLMRGRRKAHLRAADRERGGGRLLPGPPQYDHAPGRGRGRRAGRRALQPFSTLLLPRGLAVARALGPRPVPAGPRDGCPRLREQIKGDPFPAPHPTRVSQIQGSELVFHPVTLGIRSLITGGGMRRHPRTAYRKYCSYQCLLCLHPPPPSGVFL